MQRNRFEALSRICLNNWHYIERKVLSFHEDVNFFTGHSGSGKSTVIDALQILLYASADGRSFFNKAATDDSDRSIMEYLRGMITSDEDGKNSYLRNQNFSTTIVMELQQSDTKECQSIGVVFDVTPSSNTANRMFFWHKGPLFDNHYRNMVGAMTSSEIRDYLRNNYEKDSYFIGKSDEGFREHLYSEYLGGLDKERFPKLFKRAIPFRMNIRLEEFVKEYICMEKDIHIEEMQESVRQYGMMKRKIDETYKEIEALEGIEKSYHKLKEVESQIGMYDYFVKGLELRGIKHSLEGIIGKVKEDEEQLERQEEAILQLESQLQLYEEKKEELTAKVLASGYEQIKEKLESINEWIQRLEVNVAHWQTTSKNLLQWKEVEGISSQLQLQIDYFNEQRISNDQLLQLKEDLECIKHNLEEEKSKIEVELTKLRQDEILKEEEKKKLEEGRKAYPKEVEEARHLLQSQLSAQYEKEISVYVLADLLEIKNDEWRNAVEGYLANDKLLLVVEPEYAKTAMEIYQSLEKKKYHKVAVLDTKRVSEDTHRVLNHSLSEEVISSKNYINDYIAFKLGGVVKCNSIDELRQYKVGITKECVLYHSYKLQHINPEHYTIKAYIGEESRNRRIEQLREDLEQITKKKQPLIKQRNLYQKQLKQEFLTRPMDEYIQWMSDIKERKEKEEEKNSMIQQLEQLKKNGFDAMEQEIAQLKEEIKNKSKQKDTYYAKKGSIETKVNDNKKKIVDLEQVLIGKEQEFLKDEQLEEKLELWLEKEKLGNTYEACKKQAEKAYDNATKRFYNVREDLKELRIAYTNQYPNRANVTVDAKDNSSYTTLLEKLRVKDLEHYRECAEEQAKKAMDQFKYDFAYKIRDAIKEAELRKKELNRMIGRLNFGKDKYQFVIGKHKGYEGKFYDMFMSEHLDVNPKSLSNGMEYQTNIFTMAQESQYDEEIRELMEIFVPVENVSKEEQELAKQNMKKYADYRTYLSFDMEQIIEGEEKIKQSVSKTIRKNSGGEGQNPLYVALLSSFAQMYQIETSARLYRNPTIRLVILDEAFSKMDGEKVATCIELIRGLGFQAIISATNDKIQNYLENVDKTFLFANPNKKMISIQEFERKEFQELEVEVDE